MLGTLQEPRTHRTIRPSYRKVGENAYYFGGNLFGVSGCKSFRQVFHNFYRGYGVGVSAYTSSLFGGLGGNIRDFAYPPLPRNPAIGYIKISWVYYIYGV
jgi:hypothetical protein